MLKLKRGNASAAVTLEHRCAHHTRLHVRRQSCPDSALSRYCGGSRQSIHTLPVMALGMHGIALTSQGPVGLSGAEPEPFGLHGWPPSEHAASSYS